MCRGLWWACGVGIMHVSSAHALVSRLARVHFSFVLHTQTHPEWFLKWEGHAAVAKAHS